jgi:hypothetical protein
MPTAQAVIGLNIFLSFSLKYSFLRAFGARDVAAPGKILSRKDLQLKSYGIRT